MMVGKVYRNIMFIQLSISILSLLSSNIDNIIVGKFMSAEELAACGLVEPVVAIASILAGVITTGIKTVCSRSIGAGRRQQANDQISSAAVFSLIVFTAFCICCYDFIDNIVMGLAGNSDPGFMQHVKDYMLGYLLFVPSLGVLSLFIYILQINNKATYCIGAATTFIVMNVALDLLNVFLLKWGLFGIGLGTAISYMIMVSILISGYFRVNTTLRISLKVFHWKHLGNIVKNGITNAIATGTSMIIKMVVNLVVLNSVGTDGLAAVTVIVSFSGILLAVSKAIAYCTDMTSGMFFGERNVQGLRDTIKVFTRYSVVFNLILAAIVFTCSQWLCLIFINANEVAYPMAVDALRIFSLCLIFYSIPDCFVYFFLGIKRPVHAYVLAAVLNLMLGVFSAILIPKFMVNGAALAYVLGYASVCVIIVIYFTIRNKKGPFNPDNYILLPENFEIEDKYIYECMPKDKEDLIEKSKEAGDFCKRFEDNIHNRMAISLAIEELGTNVFDYGIKNKRNYIFEIRIVFDKERNVWIVRTRDDCAMFNPIKFLEMSDSKNKDDKTKNVGLGLVLKIANKAEYYNTMGLNNLVVEF